jgi:hypothetical protein
MITIKFSLILKLASKLTKLPACWVVPLFGEAFGELLLEDDR